MAYGTKIKIILLSIFFASCGMERVTCEETIKDFKDLEFGMKLDKFELEGNRLHLYGKSSENKDVEFHNYAARTFQFIIDEFHKNDVIVKKKGDDFLKIYHGKDHFKFTYMCEEEYGEKTAVFKQERF